MKKYRITVNGQTYEVEVEEVGGNISQIVPVQEQTPVAKIEQPKPQPQPKPEAKPKASGTTGKNKVTAPMPVQFCRSKRK